MYRLKFKILVFILLTAMFISQVSFAEGILFETKYGDKVAYAIEDKYITEAVKFDIPYALTKYNVTRTKDSGFLFIRLVSNKISYVYYNDKGQLVFSNAFDNYNSIDILDGKNVSLVLNRYNLSSFGSDLNSITITEDDEYFYIPVTTTGDKYTLCQVRISKETGILDKSYLNIIYEIKSSICYSFSSVQALDNSGNSLYVINVDKNILENDKIVGLLHEIYVVDNECKLMFSEEIRFSNLNNGDLLRKKSVSHQAVINNGTIYFTEGVKYEKYNDTGVYNEGILYLLSENTSKVSLNELADENHYIENGEYYSAHIIPTDEGLGCIYNYCDVKNEKNKVYTYYSAIASFSYTNLDIQFIKYYAEVENIETSEGTKVKYQNYVDLLNLEGQLTIVQEIREPSDDLLFQGVMQDIIFLKLDKSGNVSGLLSTRSGLTNSELKYGSTYIGDTLYVYDNLPQYDKYTETVPDDTVIKFISMGYGSAFKAFGFNRITTTVIEPVNVLKGITIKNYLNENVIDFYAEYNGELLKKGMFSSDMEGLYTVNIRCKDNEGRIFSFTREINVVEKPPVTNPHTDDSSSSILLLFFITMLITLYERRLKRCQCLIMI